MAKYSVLGFLLFFIGFLAGANAVAKIDPKLTQQFLLGGALGGSGDTQNVMVSFSEGIRGILDRVNHLNVSSLAEKRDALMNAQQAFADTVQAGLKGVLRSMGIPFKSFWISNKVIVPNVDSRIVRIISRIPGVAKVEMEPEITIEPFEDEGEVTFLDVNTTNSRQARQTSSWQWGVDKIRAKEVWNKYTGKGVVIAGIDTGVRHTHTLIEKNWRRSYGWYDPYDKTALPSDDGGHGTHTIGTIVGAHSYGVAPGATWIACKGCRATTCGVSELLACGQWVLCPTRPDGTGKNCAMAPHIVSNSWGGSGGDPWYEDVIKSWRSAGIIPVFSGGNRGPACGTRGSPGDGPNAISVGSMDSDDRISPFSSLGPANDGRIKPDIAAPGGSIRSASHLHDYQLAIKSGTSMACPHVSGVIALMKEKNPTLTYEQVYDILTKSAVKTMNPSRICGNVKRTDYPNNIFGWGRLDAVNAINATEAAVRTG